MDGFTGFNPDTVRKQIDDFTKYGRDVYLDLKNAFDDFMRSLQKAWCSPRALGFYEDSKIFSVYAMNISKAYKNVAVRAIRAYNSNASAHGLSTIDSSGYYSGEELYNFGLQGDGSGSGDFSYVKLYDRDPNTGAIGMDINKCSIIKDDFVRKVKEITKRIDYTPYDIAFFDPNGTQKNAYKQEIVKISDKFIDCFEDIINDFRNCLENEADQVAAAREESINVLMG
jgi:hypothetical protein